MLKTRKAILSAILVLAVGADIAAFAQAGSKPVARSAANAKPATARVTFRTDPSPAKGGASNTIVVEVRDGSGKPITDAQVKVTLVMPAMPEMGMAEMRQSAELKWDEKQYSGNVTVPTTGTWNVTVEVNRDGQRVAVYRTTLRAQ